MVRAVVLWVAAGVAEGYVGPMLWMWGYSWGEYRSVCLGMGVGVRMLLMVSPTLALRYLCARTQIRRERDEAMLPSRHPKRAVTELVLRTPVDVRSLQLSGLANCLPTRADRRWRGNE